jgi:hypothetical protein
MPAYRGEAQYKGKRTQILAAFPDEHMAVYRQYAALDGVSLRDFLAASLAQLYGLDRPAWMPDLGDPDRHNRSLPKSA